MCFWGQGRSGRGYGSGTYGEEKELSILQRETKQEILISQYQNERKKSHPATSSVGTFLCMWDFLFYSAIWPIFRPAKLWEVWNPAGESGMRLFSPVLSSRWTPETICDSLGFSLCVYCRKTLGRVSLKEWSPVIPPLSHRVSLKVQVK